MKKIEKWEWGPDLTTSKDYEKAQEAYNKLCRERLEILEKELDEWLLESDLRLDTKEKELVMSGALTCLKKDEDEGT